MSSRILLCSHILQSLRQSDNAETVFPEITAKILSLLQAVHVAIYKLDRITDISGHIIAEAIALDSCPQIDIENILNDEYTWIQSVKSEMIGCYKAGKDYLLVPIVLPESDRNNNLWGFLTVHQGSEINGEDGFWDEDDVLMLQQIAMQIETAILKDDALMLSQQKKEDTNRINEELQCHIEELRISGEEVITQHQEIEYEQERYQNLFNNAPDGYLATFSSGIIVEANQTVLDLLTVSREYILGKPFAVFVAPQHLEIFYNQLNYLSSHPNIKTSYEITLTPHQREPFSAEITVTQNINPVANKMQIFWIVRDITHVKLAEAKLAIIANRAKTEFLSMMSHELRTPMNAVLGMTEILENTTLSEQQQEYVGTIRKGGEILLSVINNILDFSRIESGQLELEEHPFKLQKCIDEVLELMAVCTAKKSIKLVAIIDLDVPQNLLGDYARLRQILVNLVSNASELPHPAKGEGGAS